MSKGTYKYVWLKNEGPEDFKRTVNGTDYDIKRGKRIRLRRHEAVQVRGTYSESPVYLTITPIYEEDDERDPKLEALKNMK